MSEPTPLADHLAWLATLGDAPCTGCRYKWGSLGRGYGHGWVRLTTDPGCPEHAPLTGRHALAYAAHWRRTR